MAGWFGVAHTFLALIGFLVVAGSIPNNSLGFGALAGVAIISVSLTAILSRAMGITDASGALGLPAGSIRALLALGLAIVFVAVASWTLGGLFDPTGRQVAQLTFPSSEVGALQQRYPATEYMISETQRPQAGDTAPVSEVKVYVKRSVDPSLVDMAKQILTISATVLVTIIGFYFGSNYADTARSVTESLNKGTPNGEGQVKSAVTDPHEAANAIASIGAATKASFRVWATTRCLCCGGPLSAPLTRSSRPRSPPLRISSRCSPLRPMRAAADADRAKDAARRCGVLRCCERSAGQGSSRRSHGGCEGGQSRVRTGAIEVPGRAQHNTPQDREGLTRRRKYLLWPSQRFQHARELAQYARRRRRDSDICSGPSAGDVGQDDDAASRPNASVSGRKRIGLVEAQFLSVVDGRTDPPPNFAGGDSAKDPRCTGPLFVATTERLLLPSLDKRNTFGVSMRSCSESRSTQDHVCRHHVP